MCCAPWSSALPKKPTNSYEMRKKYYSNKFKVLSKHVGNLTYYIMRGIGFDIHFCFFDILLDYNQ